MQEPSSSPIMKIGKLWKFLNKVLIIRNLTSDFDYIDYAILID